MANGSSVTWPVEPHTKAKHEILAYYLKAWFAIQAKRPKRLLYIDGFSGPGEYAGGEPGSPVVALRVAKQHSLLPQLTKAGMELVFLFIEEDKARYANLERKIAEIEPHLPNNFLVQKANASFEHEIDRVLRSVEEQGRKMAPSFVFVDPFGPTGFPMALVERIAKQPRAEVLINFSYQPLNQWFLQDASKHYRLNELYGDDRWRPALDISDPYGRERFLVQGYLAALGEHGWRGVSFRMINKHNQTQYHLMFGTTHYLGMLAMKRAMWSASPVGSFSYSDLSNPNQPRLFLDTMDEDYAKDLAELITRQRRGQTCSKQSIIENELAFHPTAIERHLTRALRILEYEGIPPRIARVTKSTRSPRRSGTYPDDCLITFRS